MLYILNIYFNYARYILDQKIGYLRGCNHGKIVPDSN